MNQTIKVTEIKTQLKPGHLPLKQKARPIPYHLQNYVEKELNKLNKSGHLEKVQKTDEDKSVKIALNSRNSNNSCTKMRPHMPNMEELINQISTEITRVPNERLWISKIDLEYAHGQLKLSDETSRHCNF